MNVVQKTIYVSLAAQIIAMIISIAGLGIPVSPQNSILRSILGMESFVQVIESMFYTWFGIFSPQTSSKTDIAKYRYYDWFLTTPTMLLSTMMYFQHRNENDILETETFVNNSSTNNSPSSSNTTNKQKNEPNKQNGNVIGFIKEIFGNIVRFTKQHWGSVSKILLFNTLMLLMGYLREINILSVFSSTLVGFFFFGAMFYLLFYEFARFNTKNYPIYYIMLGLWSLYGVAAMFGPIIKNSSYNILDIFSKNFYSVFIAIYIYTLYKK